MLVVAVALSSVCVHVMLYLMQRSYQDQVEHNFWNNISANIGTAVSNQQHISGRLERLMNKAELNGTRNEEQVRKLDQILHQLQSHVTKEKK
jgi:cell division protein FtsX